MNNIRQSAICRHFKKMLEAAEEAEKKGKLKDSGKTVANIKETIERMRKDTKYLQIIANIRCCPEFPCNIVEQPLRHNNVNVRSTFYEWAIKFCTDCHFYQQGILLLCNKMEGSEMFTMLNSLEREELSELFGL